VRDRGAQALASRRPPVVSGHVGGRPGLVDEHKALRVEVELVFEPSLAPEIRETKRQRVEEWKMVADRFAAQTEQVLAAQTRRSWWPFRSSA
jgi:hypothetical protein